MRYLPILLITAGLATAPAQTNAGVEYLGHVGLGVTDLTRALHFYCDQLGLTEAFRLKKPDGTPSLVYLRINNNNFVELFPGAKEQGTLPRGATAIRHLGLFVKDLQSTLHILKERGYPISDEAIEQAKVPKADGTLMTFVKDPDGNAVELSQITPDSLQAKSRK
jgi:lactoylglutathione lyase